MSIDRSDALLGRAYVGRRFAEATGAQIRDIRGRILATRAFVSEGFRTLDGLAAQRARFPRRSTGGTETPAALG